MIKSSLKFNFKFKKMNKLKKKSIKKHIEIFSVGCRAERATPVKMKS